MKTVYRVTGAMMLVAGISLSTAAVAHHYDAFSVGTILNGTRWNPGPVEENGAIEFIRKVQAGVLRMKIRSIGDRTQTTGASMDQTNQVFLAPKRADGLYSMHAQIKVRSVKVRGCTAIGADITTAKAAISSLSFNDGSQSVPGDMTGEITSSIEIRKDSNDGLPASMLRVMARITRCSDATCSAQTDIVAPVFLTTMNKGDTAVLRNIWVPEDQEFLWRVAPQGLPLVEVRQGYETLLTVGERNLNIDKKGRIEATTEVADCDMSAVSGAAPFAVIDIDVDDVKRRGTFGSSD